ncbi:MAG TPA: VPLPA-CTERM sorting domain-containing protein [Nitrospira sp.]|nr:VPLPA-CTERM sorting domain-containing protein [Nitrospira sp.]
MSQFKQRIHLRTVGLTLGAFCSLFAAITSEAANIPFNFSGSVAEVHGGVFTSGGSGANGFGSALPVSGSFTFNSTTPDVLPGDPMWGLYANPIQNMTVKVGNYTATFTPGSSVMQVINNPGLGDTFKVTLNGFTSSPATVSGLAPATFEMELVNPNGNVFANDHLPTTPPSLSSFASNQWRLVFGGVGNRVQGALTSLVPLPAAVWLFGAGLIALVGLGSRGLVSRKES